MKTFLPVLRLAFWINPLQRLLTCLAVLLVLAHTIGMLGMYFARTHSLRTENVGAGTHYVYRPVDHFLLMANSEFSQWGVIIATFFSLLMAGVYWRVASAPRIVRLAPYGRARLLGSFAAVILLIALLATVERWLGLLGLFLVGWRNAEGSPGFGIPADMVSGALLASLAVVSLFVASRSPLAALFVLIVLFWPFATDTMIAMPHVRWAESERESFLLVLLWIPFAIWYLRASSISPPGWLAGGSKDVLATTLVSSAPPRSRGEALQRQLLGGTTVIRFGAQWFVILGFLLGLQALLARMAETEASLSARVMYASLCICPIVTTMMSFAAIRRSRALWLLASSTRGEFYACVERILARMNVVMALVFGAWLTALWFAHPWHPGFAHPLHPADSRDQAALVYVVGWSLWLPGWFAIYAQLAGWPKWPVAMVAAATPALFWAATVAGDSTNEPAREIVACVFFVIVMTATVALRWQAQRRWREGDFPRALASTTFRT